MLPWWAYKWAYKLSDLCTHSRYTSSQQTPPPSLNTYRTHAARAASAAARTVGVPPSLATPMVGPTNPPTPPPPCTPNQLAKHPNTTHAASCTLPDTAAPPVNAACSAGQMVNALLTKVNGMVKPCCSWVCFPLGAGMGVSCCVAALYTPLRWCSWSPPSLSSSSSPPAASACTLVANSTSARCATALLGWPASCASPCRY